MGAQLGTKGAMSEINMTPLIDIVLVVLIIMMVNVPIAVESLGVKLPSKVETKPPPDAPVEQLVVALYEDGKVALNRTVYTEEQLFFQIGERLKSMTNKIVFIDAHPSVNYGVVVDYVDLAKEAGAEKVSFAKLKPEGPLAWTDMGQGALPAGVYLHSPGTAGAMTEKQAYDQFQPAMSGVQACFAARQAANPAIASGRLVVQVDVGPDGEVMDTKVVTNTTGDAELGTCVEGHAKALRFKALGEQLTARAHYPLTFSTGR